MASNPDSWTIRGALFVIDLFYNGMIAVMVLLWVMGTRARRFGRIIALLKARGPIIAVLLWAVFLVFAGWYLLDFDHFAEIHDIDDAVDAAVTNTNDGVNAYEEYVIPRFKGRYTADVEWALGPYNYMPLDLFVYVGAKAVLGAFGSPEWFAAANLIFTGLAMVMLRDIVRTRWMSFAPLAGTVMLFYSMDNASLTLLLMTASVYALHKSRWHPEALALVLMGMAVLTKVYAAIPFLVMLLYFVQSSYSARDWRRLTGVIAAAGLSAAVAVVVMLPFGISNVLDAAVFFHTSADARAETSAGGTLLSEVLLENEHFAILGALVTVAAIVIGLKFRSLNDRVMIAAIAFLMIAVKSSLAPLTVPGLFLALRLRELADERAAEAARVASSAPAAEGNTREASRSGG
jgi:hypothetical protein